MNKRVLYALPATALAAVALALSVAGYMAASKKPAAPLQATVAQDLSPVPEVPRYQYLMAVRALSPGEIMTADSFTSVASDKPVPEAIAVANPPFGKAIETGLSAGQILTDANLRSDSVLAKLVAPGYQAMAIAVDDVAGVGGLLRPGDRVNVTAAFRRSDKDKPAALRLLENVLVIAVKGVPYEGDPDENNDQRRNSTVVLAVPEEQVSALLLASSEGSLRLAAVAPEQEAPDRQQTASTKDPVQTAVYLDDLFPSPPPRRTVSRPSTHVQVFEGAESRNVYVR